MRKQLVVFDFDGTLTRHDTFLRFALYSRGWSPTLWAFFQTLPFLIMMKLRLYPNGKAKERVFGHLFKGLTMEEFEHAGKNFVPEINKMLRPEVVEQLHRHQRQGDTLYVISASVEQWIRPWCQQAGIQHVIATQAQTDGEGRLTGRFSTPNCYGCEKVRRLLAEEPQASQCGLTAYGDSGGDRELLELALATGGKVNKI